MNDEELLTLVREQRDKIPMTAPVSEITRRGRSIRSRRRIGALAGGLGAIAAAALLVTALTPAAPQAKPPASTVRLAAWIVSKQPNGDVVVTINDLRDPAGLQAKLRSEGLPVSVSFSPSWPPLSPSCQPYGPPKTMLKKVGDFHFADGAQYLVIHPSAIPAGLGLSIFDLPNAGTITGSRGTGGPLAVSLVYASSQCTG